MNRFKTFITFFTFALMLLALPTVASAQWRDRDRDRDDDYYRNGRYHRNLNATVKNLRNQSRQFARRLDRELDRSRYDDRRREDHLNRLAEDFRHAADRLEDRYDKGRDYRRSESEARRVLDLGAQLDRALYRARLSRSLENDWYRIRQDLDILADAYGYNRRYRGNYPNRRNDDWRRRIPFPFPFPF